MPSRHEDFHSLLSARVRAGAQHLDVPWTQERAERVRAGIVKRHQVTQRRRKLLRAGGVAALLLLALWLPRLLAGQWPLQDGAGAIAGVGSGAGAQLPAASSSRSAEPALPSSLQLADGSSARPRGNSAVAVREESAARVVVELLHGGAEFQVSPSSQRLFRVAAAGVAVESSGSRFSVDKQPAGAAAAQALRVAVAVAEGRVRVFWAGQQAVLVAGERVEFQVSERSLEFTGLTPSQVPSASSPPSLSSVPAPRSAPSIAAESPAVPAIAATPAAVSRAAASPQRAAPSWQQLARAGEFDRAYQQAFASPRTGSTPVVAPSPTKLRLSPVVPANPQPADLLLLADVARMSHHPASAIAPLRRLLEQHSEDPRAPLAAFTLGRVLLDDMAQPREAAESFRRTQALDAEGPLSHDALAREVEAWSRAGELSKARERAREYIRLYPSGRRLAAVRRLAELSTAAPAQPQ